MRIFHQIAALGGAALIASPLLAAPPPVRPAGPPPSPVIHVPPLPGIVLGGHKNVDGRPWGGPPRLEVSVGPDSPRGPVRVQVVRDEEQRTWLGVQLGPVPSALASHLGLDKNGLIVRNVYAGSPADRAGLQRYDVLVQADGQAVSGRLEDFSRHVRSKASGDKLTLKLYRGGKETTLEIELEAEPRGTHKFKYDDDEPDVLFRRDFDLRGKILRPGPNGWEVFDLGELPDFKGMFREMEGFLPRSREVIARRVEKDEVLQVRRLRDGTIEVRRETRGASTQPEGSGPRLEARISVYEDLNTLWQQDPEAAELLDQQTRADEADGPRWHWRVPGEDRGERLREFRERFFRGPRGDRDGGPMMDRGPAGPRDEPRFDGPRGFGDRPDEPPRGDGRPGRDRPDGRPHGEGGHGFGDRPDGPPHADGRHDRPGEPPRLDGPRGHGDRPGEPPRGDDRRGRGGRPDAPPAGPRPPMTQPAGPDAPPRPDVLRVPGGRAAMREPSVRFDVKPDGAITVTTREGDNELSVTYGSREAFKSAAPELFKRFEAAEKRIR